MEKKRIIAVLGMHRSGTSTLARSLKTLSVDLGDNLLPAVPGDNDRGFWEDVDIQKLNERTLSDVGSGWIRLSSIDYYALTRNALSQRRFEATALLQSKIETSDIFGFKDPRTSILLPFWNRVFEDVEAEPSYVVAVRNPLEVAASLKRRNAFEATYSLALWLKYTMAAIEGSSGSRRVFVSYANLMKDPAVELTRVAGALELPLPKPSSSEFIDYVGDFINPELRRNRISDNEVARFEQAPALLSDFYKTLLDWCRAEPGAELQLPDDLHQAWNSFQINSRMLLSLGDQLQGSLERTRTRASAAEKAQSESAQLAERQKAEIEAKTADNDRVNSELEAEKNAAAALTTTIAQLREQLTDAELQRAENERIIAECEVQNRRLDSQWREERARAEASQQSVETALQAMYKRLSDEKLAELNIQLAQRDAALDEMKIDLRLARHESRALRDSTSWKLTRPLRAAARMVSRTMRAIRPRSRISCSQSETERK